MTNRTLAFIYARSDSVRLPRKPFADLDGRSLFEIVCARVARVIAAGDNWIAGPTISLERL